MNQIIRLGVTGDAIRRIGKRKCMKIGKVVIANCIGEDEDDIESTEEVEFTEIEKEFGISILFIEDGNVTTVLMGMDDAEPWTEDGLGPKPLYDKITEWFEL